MTGIMDNKYTNGREKYVDKDGKEYELKDFLTELKQVAIDTNKEWAKKLGINVSAAITCTKPSGCLPFSALTATNKGLFILGELLQNHPKNEIIHHVILSKQFLESIINIEKQYDGQVGTVQKLFSKVSMGKELIDEDVNHRNRIEEIRIKYRHRIIGSSTD